MRRESNFWVNKKLLGLRPFFIADSKTILKSMLFRKNLQGIFPPREGLPAGVCIKQKINQLIFNSLGWYKFAISIIMPDSLMRELLSLG